jgi:UDP-glucuronate decarboxylase
MHPNDGRVVSNFVMQSLQDEPMTIYGTGSQTRSFQYVRDLVIGLIRLMNSDETSPVNIGNPEETTITEFAALVKEVTNSKVDRAYLPGTEDDPKKRKPNISKAKRVLGWKPTFPVRTGVSKTADYFREELGLTDAFTTIWMDQDILKEVELSFDLDNKYP